MNSKLFIVCKFFLLGSFLGGISCATVPQEQGFLLTYDGTPYALNDLPADVRSDIYNTHSEYLAKMEPLLKRAALEIHRKKTTPKYDLQSKSSESELVTSSDPRLAAINQEVTDEELKAFYEENKAMLPYPFEKIKFELRSIARERIQERRRAVILGELENSGRLMFHLYRLHTPRIDIALDGLPVAGSKTAKIKIVEFGDFTCPYCRKAYPVLKEFVEAHKDQVGLYFYPYASHDGEFGGGQAREFAVMGECIHRLKPERYWDFQHMVFTGDSYGVPSASKVAAELKVSEPDLQVCLQDEDVQALVRRQQYQAVELGVVKTPTLFINGELFVGEITRETLEQSLEQFLE